MRKKRKKASLNAAAAKDNHKLGAMFLGMSGTSKQEKKKQKTIVDDGDELDEKKPNDFKRALSNSTKFKDVLEYQ